MTIEYSEYQHKLSPDSKKLLLVEKPAEDETLHILFQTKEPPSEQQLDEIEEAGCRIQTAAGDVLTCEIAVEDIPKLAILDFVVSVQVSRPLYPEE